MLQMPEKSHVSLKLVGLLCYSDFETFLRVEGLGSGS